MGGGCPKLVGGACPEVGGGCPKLGGACPDKGGYGCPEVGGGPKLDGPPASCPAEDEGGTFCPLFEDGGGGYLCPPNICCVGPKLGG